jgi:hypothetical protein
MQTIGLLQILGLGPVLLASLWPSGLGCWAWGIIILVLYFINVLMSARVLLPVGLPDSTKLRRIKNSFLLSLILSWPNVYLIILMLSELGEAENSMGLIGALIAWVFFVVIDFIANWKLFEAYFPMRKTLGGSDAYANLHRHIWGHLLAIVGIIILGLGVFIWHVMR